MSKLRIIHYINQFYGQIGGEDKADQVPIIQSGSVGPGSALQGLMGDNVEIVATIICGDTYFAENSEKATDEILEFMADYEFDGLIAGPAFNAGRYGMACGAVCKAAKDRFNVPVLTAMYPENPGAELYCKDIYVLECGKSAAGMGQTLKHLSEFAMKLFTDKEIGFPEEEGYIPQGRRVNVWKEKTGAIRAVEMLLKKMKGEEFTTELPMPIFDKIDPASPIEDIKTSTIALVTSGGIVPKGNPDHIEAANATKFGKYDINNLNDLNSADFETVHGGYDPVYALEDPDRVLPLDAMRDLEKDGVIGKLHDSFYSTVGNTTAVTSAEKFGKKIGEELLEAGVDGVILTST